MSEDRREPDVEDRRLETLPGDMGSTLLWWLLSPMERRLVLRLLEALRSVLPPSSGETGCEPRRGTLVADILVDGALRSPVLLRRVPFLGKVAGPGGLLVRRSVSRCLRCRVLLLIRRLLLFPSISVRPLLLSSITLSCIRELLPFMRELLPFMRELLPFIRLPLLLPPALSLRLLRLLSPPLELETEEECSLAEDRVDLRCVVSSGKDTSAKSLPKESSNSSSSNSDVSKGSKAD